ncbi:MAG: hypothetical protein QW590_02320 [Candidatus Bilamarchaeaceae archaeon]
MKRIMYTERISNKQPCRAFKSKECLVDSFRDLRSGIVVSAFVMGMLCNACATAILTAVSVQSDCSKKKIAADVICGVGVDVGAAVMGPVCGLPEKDKNSRVISGGLGALGGALVGGSLACLPTVFIDDPCESSSPSYHQPPLTPPPTSPESPFYRPPWSPDSPSYTPSPSPPPTYPR